MAWWGKPSQKHAIPGATATSLVDWQNSLRNAPLAPDVAELTREEYYARQWKLRGYNSEKEESNRWAELGHIEDYWTAAGSTAGFRRVRNMGKDLREQLATGYCEVNLLPLSVEDILLLGRSVKNHAGLVTLKLKVFNRKRVKETRKDLVAAVEQVSKTLQSLRCVKDFSRAIESLLRNTTTLQDLEVGASARLSGLPCIGRGLALTGSLRRLSLAGSCMGDAGLVKLELGLVGNCSLEVLDLRGCDLCDASVHVLTALIKEHSARRSQAEWQGMLRSQPQSGRVGAKDLQLLHAHSKRHLAQLGGLVKLDLSDNNFTHAAVVALCEALTMDRRMKLFAMRSNGLAMRSAKVLDKLLREHHSLQEVDLSGNADPRLGILRSPRNMRQVGGGATPVLPKHGTRTPGGVHRVTITKSSAHAAGLSVFDTYDSNRESQTGSRIDAEESEREALLHDVEDAIRSQDTDADTAPTQAPDRPAAGELEKEPQLESASDLGHDADISSAGEKENAGEDLRPGSAEEAARKELEALRELRVKLSTEAAARVAAERRAAHLQHENTQLQKQRGGLDRQRAEAVVISGDGTLRASNSSAGSAGSGLRRQKRANGRGRMEGGTHAWVANDGSKDGDVEQEEFMELLTGSLHNLESVLANVFPEGADPELKAHMETLKLAKQALGVSNSSKNASPRPGISMEQHAALMAANHKAQLSGFAKRSSSSAKLVAVSSTKKASARRSKVVEEDDDDLDLNDEATNVAHQLAVLFDLE